MKPIKIHPYDLAEIINNSSEIQIYKTSKISYITVPLDESVKINGQVYIQDVTAQRRAN